METQQLSIANMSLTTPKETSRASSAEDHSIMVTKPDDEEAQKEAQRQTWFDQAVAEHMKIPNGYLKVSVLIIRWKEGLDEFTGHTKEINTLSKLFREKFRFECNTVELNNTSKPQNQLNHAISTHINEHDGPNNLLILYYTGHGSLVDNDQRLQMTATRKLVERRGSVYPPTAFWDEAEGPLLTSAESDVLAILDCCFASHAVKDIPDDLRTYELLAAAPMHGKTNGPGDKSFTTALITALEELLTEHEGRKFPTVQLQQKINMTRTPPAQVWHRLNKFDRHIILAPLDDENSEEREQSFARRPQEKASLTIRFSLEDKDLKEEQIRRFAMRLTEASTYSKMNVRQIYWMGMRTRSLGFGGVVRAIHVGGLWRRRSRSKKQAVTVPSPRKRKQSDELLFSPISKRRESEAMSSGSEAILEPSTPTPQYSSSS